MAAAILGIDIAKKKFDVALLVDGKYKHKTIANTQPGFEELGAWLSKKDIHEVHACMEATGNFWEALATYLYDAGHVVSVVNPARIKSFGESELSRTKTDKTDAKLIARFCEAMKPTPWQPDPPEIRKLKALGRRRDALVSMKTQEINRKTTCDQVVNQSIQTVVEVLDQQIETITKQIKDHIENHPDLKQKRDLIKSIPGIGDITAEVVLSEFSGFTHFNKIEQAIAYMGLSPKERSSGSSVRGKSKICKIGSIRLRKALFMPALVAAQHNPAVKALYGRLKAKSKNGLIIACACMKKLVQIIFGVVKNNKPFDPYYELRTA
jgi:transposase